jgi:hypothetical protein
VNPRLPRRSLGEGRTIGKKSEMESVLSPFKQVMVEVERDLRAR